MNSLIAKLDDWLNPILVKELRQTVRGKAFWGVYMLFLAITSIIFIASVSDGALSNRYASEIIEYMFNVLFFVCFGLVPLHVAKQITSEQSDATNELLQITTIKPEAVIMGKYLCGAFLVLMLYSAFIPFMSLSLFMGGIDLGDLFVALAFSFVISQIAILVAIAAGQTIGKAGSLKQAWTGAVFVIFIGLWAFCQNFCLGFFEGHRLYFGLQKEPGFVVAVSVIAILNMFIIFSFNVALRQSENSNKMYSFRKRFTIAWLLSLAIPIVRTSFAEFWLVSSIIAIVIASLIAHGEPETYSRRVIREIPDSFWGKILKFPFFYGLLNSFVWVSLATWLICVLFNIYNVFIYSTSYGMSRSEDVTQVIVALFLYVNAYGFWGNIIRKLFFKKSGKVATVAIAVVLYIILGLLIPFFGSEFGFAFDSFADFFNPFAGRHSSSNFSKALLSGGLFLFLGMLLNGFALIKQLRSYFSKESEDWDEAYFEE